MKEKIKEFLLHFLIIYVVFIVIISLVKLINYPTEIELNDSEEHIQKYTELKKEASLILEDNDCHNAIKDVVEFYEHTSFKGKVKIQNFYNDEDNVPLNLCSKLRNNCSNYEDRFNMENIYGKITTTGILYERIFYKTNLFKYEFNISDVFARLNYDSELTTVEYEVERRLELEIIRELLNIVKEEKINEE